MGRLGPTKRLNVKTAKKLIARDNLMAMSATLPYGSSEKDACAIPGPIARVTLTTCMLNCTLVYNDFARGRTN